MTPEIKTAILVYLSLLYLVLAVIATFCSSPRRMRWTVAAMAVFGFLVILAIAFIDF